MKIADYDGTIRLLKLPTIHSLCGLSPDFDVYALKQKGKMGLQVEKIHLEPEEDRADQDENLMQKGSKISSVACNPTKSHKIDF